MSRNAYLFLNAFIILSWSLFESSVILSNIEVKFSDFLLQVQAEHVPSTTATCSLLFPGTTAS